MLCVCVSMHKWTNIWLSQNSRHRVQVILNGDATARYWGNINLSFSYVILTRHPPQQHPCTICTLPNSTTLVYAFQDTCTDINFRIHVLTARNTYLIHQHTHRRPNHADTLRAKVCSWRSKMWPYLRAALAHRCVHGFDTGLGVTTRSNVGG